MANSITAPLLTKATRSPTEPVRAFNENGEEVSTLIAGEHPLTIYLNKQEIVTLMTLGVAPEALVLGYLRNQRLIDDIRDIASVQVDWEAEAAAVTTRSGRELSPALTEHRTVTSGCGQGTMFGNLMADIDRLRLPQAGKFYEATLKRLLDNVRLHESIYKQAGAVHGCALATHDGEILMFVEDVGRHNAVDAIAGLMWLSSTTGGDKIFYTTGRLTSEMVIKAAQMGIPSLVSRSGLTAMGYRIAQKVGITLVGRAQGRHFLIFTGHERFAPIAPS